jgi:N utilization substance protein B
MNPKQRSKSRRYVLQALYQWQLSGCPVQEIESQYLHSMKSEPADEPFFIALFQGIVQFCTFIDTEIQLFLDRKLTELTPIELNILRIGTYELLHCLETPYRVVINEALELTKSFGSTDDGFKYVNGVLDKIARKCRSVEI